MMRSQIRLILGLTVLLIAVAGTAQATVLTFAMNAAGAVPGNNSDITATYGSNVTAANIIGATDGGEGFTPDIALVWAPTGGAENVPGGSGPDADILEFHSAATFTGAGLTVPVLQLDVDASNHLVLPGHPTLDFVPDAAHNVKIFGLKLGNATDQGAGETPHPWTISVLELPSLTPTGYSYTTAAMGAGMMENVVLNFAGAQGVSYRLLFDDGDLGCTTSACHNPRTGIDEVRFGQGVPEPSTLALVALCGLGLLVNGRRK